MNFRRLVVLGLALLLVPAPQPARGAETRALGDLRWLEDAYYEHLMRDRPDLATRCGLKGAETMLVPVNESSLLEDDPALAELETRIARVDRGGLGADGLARLDSLIARVARERAPYLSGAWHTDPLSYLAVGPWAVLDVATLEDHSTCTRARFAERRLRMVPEVLRCARINLAQAQATEGVDDVSPWEAALDSLRVLPDRLENCRDSQRQADLIEADSLAVAALERFLKYLREERTVVR